MKQRQSRGLMPWILTLLCAVLLTVWVLGSMPAAPKEGAAVAAGTAYLDSAAAKDASAIAETLREREKQRRAELLAQQKKEERDALVVCSLVFFAWGTPEYLVLMVLDIAFHYFAGRELALQKARGRSGRFVLVSSVLVNLLLLGFFKYYGFLVDNLNALLGTALRARELPMPIGVSFFTFSLLSYLFDVYRDRAPAARNVLDFSLYVTFFPKLVSGPIVQYAEMEPQLRDHPVTREGFGSGARLFLIGLAK